MSHRISKRFRIERLKEVPPDQEIIGYARVSSLEQATNSKALKQQIKRLEDAGATLIVKEVKSGKRDDRAGLREVMLRVEHTNPAEVIVTRLDRLGRSVPTVRKNVEIFQKTGVNLRALDQMIDLKTPQGMFMVNLLASLAEIEVQQLAERVKHGKAHRRKKHAACECIPFGYTVAKLRYQLDHSKFLCLVKHRPDNYLELYEVNNIEHLPGLSVAQIARDCVTTFLKVKGTRPTIKLLVEKYGLGRCHVKANGSDKIFYWSPTGLRTWLNNPVLCGHTVYNKRTITADGRRKQSAREHWQVIADTHPDDRLISNEELVRIQEIFDFNASRAGAALYNYDPASTSTYSEYAYLRGLVYCAECGIKCYSKTRKSKDGTKSYHYFACQYAKQGCNNIKGTPKELIEKTLINQLLQQSMAVQTATSLSDPLPTPAQSQKLQQLEERLQQLEAIGGFDPDLESLKEKTRQQIQQELNPFAHDTLNTKTVEEIIQAGNNLLIWYTLSIDEKVEIYPKVVHQILVYNNEVKSVVLQSSQNDFSTCDN